MLRHARVGPGQQDAVIGIVCAGGPDLLAVDDPFVAILDGAGLQARNIRPGRRFGKELAPDFLALHCLADIALLVLVGAERDDGRDAHPEADGEGAGRRVELAFFLVPDDLLHRRAAAPADLFRPGDLGITAFGFCLLPLLGKFHEFAAIHALAQRLVALGLEVLAEESASFGAEFGFFFGVIEVHESFLLRRHSCFQGCGRVFLSTLSALRPERPAAWRGDRRGGSPPPM